MFINKNEAKKLFPTATKITQYDHNVAFSGESTPTEKLISLEKMREEMKFSRHWHAEQRNEKLYINSTVYSFTLEF